MTNVDAFTKLSPTTLADVVSRDRVMDIGIRPLWTGMQRLVGPAFPVRCAPGDNLMVHAAIYRAAPGSVIVVQAGDVDFAVAGGNVCAVAQRRGIAGLIVDGVIRDVAETRENRFPVFARGVIPKPGLKEQIGRFGIAVVCGGVDVAPGDVVVADEEGIVVVPTTQQESILRDAQAIAEKDASTPIDAWEAAHYARTEQLLRERGFTG